MTGADRVAKHRAALKAKGMRLVQIWVPDPDNPNFIKEARREMRLLAKAAGDPASDEARVLRELDAAFDEMMVDIARDETR
ncbi:MAG: antitoxin MazE-like protein [Dongiaceae bacterium]